MRRPCAEYLSSKEGPFSTSSITHERALRPSHIPHTDTNLYQPPASMEETRLYHEEVAATERFFRSPRFAQTARPYSAQVSQSSCPS